MKTRRNENATNDFISSTSLHIRTKDRTIKITIEWNNGETIVHAWMAAISEPEKEHGCVLVWSCVLMVSWVASRWSFLIGRDSTALRNAWDPYDGQSMCTSAYATFSYASLLFNRQSYPKWLTKRVLTQPLALEISTLEKMQFFCIFASPNHTSLAGGSELLFMEIGHRHLGTKG